VGLAKKIDVTLITGRSLQQGISLEIGKTSTEYFNSVNYVEMNRSDSDALEMNKDAPVEITTSHGKVLLFWRVSEGLPQGLIFVPYSPWINQVIGTDTACTGTPNFKGIKATVSPATGKQVLTFVELMDKIKVDN